MKKQREKHVINLLLSGKHSKAKKFAGHHVLVVDEEIIPLKKGQKAIEEINRLEKKYGQTPTIVFVPRQDVTYILVCLE